MIINPEVRLVVTWPLWSQVAFGFLRIVWPLWSKVTFLNSKAVWPH